MRNSRRLRAGLLACVLVCVVGSLPSQAGASETGWKVSSALASMVYSPVKLVYATAGVVFGGIAWGLSGGNDEIMGAVITPAIHGDYVVTPAHLRGERSLEFVAHAPAYGQPEQTLVDRWEPEAPHEGGPYGY